MARRLLTSVDSANADFEEATDVLAATLFTGPTTDPHVYGKLWNSSGFVAVSAGIGHTALDSASVSSASSMATASKTPSANTLQILSVWNQDSTPTETPATPTVTGCSLTWTQVTAQEYFASGGLTDCRRLTIFKAYGTPTTGALTVDFGGTNENAICSWSEFPGASQVVQSASSESSPSTVSSLTETLAAFAAHSVTYGAFGYNWSATGGSAGSGFTKIHEPAAAWDGATYFLTEFKLSSDTSVDASVNSAADMGGIAIEIGV